MDLGLLRVGTDRSHVRKSRGYNSTPESFHSPVLAEFPRKVRAYWDRRLLVLLSWRGWCQSGICGSARPASLLLFVVIMTLA